MAHTIAFVMVAALLSTVLFCTLAPAQSPKTKPTPAAGPAGPSPAPASAQAPSAAAVSKDTGTATFYSDKYHGRISASGERYNKDALTAASNQHPFGTRLKVTNLKNNKSVVVHVNDRMWAPNPRIIDVSRQAAKQLGFLGAGTTEVKLEVVEGRKKQ
jgi:rare lipoprotein A